MNTKLWQGLAAIMLSALSVTAFGGDGPTATNAWARATAPGVDVGAVYMTIDGGAKPDRLVEASTPRAAMVHLHTVEEKDGVSRMRAVEAVEVPAGKRVELAPKGTHLMLMGLGRPLVAGDGFTVTLKFEKAGEQTVTVRVRPASGDDSQHTQH